MNTVSTLLTADDIIVSFFIWILLMFATLSVAKKLGASQRRAFLIYLWHSFFTVIYILYTNSNGADAIKYFTDAQSGNFRFNLGTGFIIGITSIFTTIGLGLLSIFFIFHFFGTIGIIAIDATLQNIPIKGRFNVFLVSIISFTPSLHFWSSAIGKDSLALLSVGLVLWSIMQLSDRRWGLILGILIMASIRPHIAFCLLFALSISLFFSTRKITITHIFVMILIIGGVVVAAPLILEYIGFGEDISLDKAQSFIELRQSYNQAGGGGIDISQLSVPMQIITYILRPLPFEAHNISALIASIDNSALLFLLIYAIFNVIRTKGMSHKKTKSQRKIIFIFLWSYIIMTVLAMATTTANLGISIRQKWMIVPMIIYLCVVAIGRTRGSKKKSVLKTNKIVN